MMEKLVGWVGSSVQRAGSVGIQVGWAGILADSAGMLAVLVD